MKRRHLPAVVAVAALALAACGSGDSATGEAPLDPSKLTIYSAQHANLVDAWVKGFTADTGIQVQVRQGKDSSMGNQLVAEGDKTQADVFLTENSPAMTVVQNAGLLSPVEQSTLDQVSQQYRPSSGEWVGIAARSTVLIYNPSKISEADLPASMLDLADPKWKGKWGAAPSGADFQAIVSGVLQAEGADRTETWLKGLKENAKVYQNNIATMKAVNAGEVPMGIMYHYYWYRDQALTKEGSANTKLHYFKGEDVGAFVSVSAGGVLKASTKQADAQKFLAWVTSAKGQEALVSSKSMEYAVGEGVASDPALPPLDSLQAPSIDPFTLDGPEVIKLMTAAGIL
ncbi:MAG TPA: iron ABC transporter substrate-binding protein [Phycicoccus elongatus]|jgi:iron(III) transport system substrate-binding protein|uniref:iron ABC transporter substrate-binding protein n=1 Tax=Phycicoccus TaxID=367298 RepID=UPI002BF4B132|nr:MULTISPECIES: iron ABC transporter substrate-binding protein [Phycicoccus]MBK8730280.1 iron ABC transporter substrate-binding protein [Tetrasphaera sp.]HPF76579.1 iron ABC transporter substrate-binding protein [Phycicoccus elongatus]HPK12982.1 iron ABC transporter substrate-binding protein [Phycicoccus elongatus]HRV58097.1 iron ABC transporter substrate-binding protein [Phycicoccus sp.]